MKIFEVSIKGEWMNNYPMEHITVKINNFQQHTIILAISEKFQKITHGMNLFL